jgi:hypothetical protein
MPVPKGTKFRVVTKGGKKIRLAIHKGKVIERKVLK